MGFNALNILKKINEEVYNIKNSVRIPDLPETPANYGAAALRFLRDSSENLEFDEQLAGGKNWNQERISAAEDAPISLDHLGKSSAPGQIPYNMEKDLNRLCLEKAVARFLESGSHEDAFDVYYCYINIFKPFGDAGDVTEFLLNLLAEQNSGSNAGFMDHNDYYTHSVYVFILGLSFFHMSEEFRAAYAQKYQFEKDASDAACHFLKHWGFAALFHDVGYPFEIAYQQMHNYIEPLDRTGSAKGLAPRVAYNNMGRLTYTVMSDLNEWFAREITLRLSTGFLIKTGYNRFFCEKALLHVFKDSVTKTDANHPESPSMDHAYFSGLIMTRAYLAGHKDIKKPASFPSAMTDALCAIILHETLFKNTLKSFLNTKDALSLYDGQPLAYLLMLCDGLHCRPDSDLRDPHPVDFDLFESREGLKLSYFFDEMQKEDIENVPFYQMLSFDGYTKNGREYGGRSAFLDRLNEAVHLKDLFPSFDPDLSMPDTSSILDLGFKKQVREKISGKEGFQPALNYYNLYFVALALYGADAAASEPGNPLPFKDKNELEVCFEKKLSLEYKMNYLMRAKQMNIFLKSIGCCLTSNPISGIYVNDFTKVLNRTGHESDLIKYGTFEHKRFAAAMKDMGWAPYKKTAVTENEALMLERTRQSKKLGVLRKADAEKLFSNPSDINRFLELLEILQGPRMFFLIT